MAIEVLFEYVECLIWIYQRVSRNLINTQSIQHFMILIIARIHLKLAMIMKLRPRYEKPTCKKKPRPWDMPTPLKEPFSPSNSHAHTIL